MFRNLFCIEFITDATVSLSRLPLLSIANFDSFLMNAARSFFNLSAAAFFVSRLSFMCLCVLVKQI